MTTGERCDVDKFIREESAKYRSLTIKESARKVVAEMGETGQIMKVAWAMEIEKALIALIQDCAEIAANEAASMAVRRQLEGGSDPMRANQTLGAGRMANLIEALIRNRFG